MNIRYAIALLLLTLSNPAAANPGAWVLDEGMWQVITTSSYYHSDERFDGAGNKIPQPTYQKFEINPYIEYGLMEHTTVGANLFLQQAKSGGESNWGLADAEFFARTRLWHTEDMVISVQPLIKIPGLFDDSSQPTIGSDDADLALSGFFGYHFNLLDKRHFSEVEMQYRHRLGTPEDQYRINATIGLTITPQWQFLAQSFTTLSSDSVRGATFTQSARDDYDLQKIQLSGVYQVDDGLSLQAGGYYNIAGRNTGNGLGAIFGVWKRF